jgi:hypothetical protein
MQHILDQAKAAKKASYDLACMGTDEKNAFLPQWRTRWKLIRIIYSPETPRTWKRRATRAQPRP